MNRQFVYDAIDTERIFQQLQHPQGNTRGEIVLLMEQRMLRAKDSLLESKSHSAYAKEMRVIAALAVKAMEDFGGVQSR